MKGTFIDWTRTKKKKEKKRKQRNNNNNDKKQLFKNDFLRYIFMHIFIG